MKKEQWAGIECEYGIKDEGGIMWEGVWIWGRERGECGNVGWEEKCGRMDEGTRGRIINEDRNNRLDMKVSGG